jgi:hypothetical protein
MTFYNAAPIRFGVDISGTTATLGVNDPELGARCTVDELDYLFVYNDGGEQVGVGQPVTISGVTGYSVTVSCTTLADMAMGVRQNSTMTTATYGWVATRGIGTVEMSVSESCVTGQILAVGAEGFGLASNSTDFQTPTVAKALESIASAASGIAFFSVF